MAVIFGMGYGRGNRGSNRAESGGHASGAPYITRYCPKRGQEKSVAAIRSLTSPALQFIVAIVPHPLRNPRMCPKTAYISPRNISLGHQPLQRPHHHRPPLKKKKESQIHRKKKRDKKYTRKELKNHKNKVVSISARVLRLLGTN